jgi:hypothetical protein
MEACRKSAVLVKHMRQKQRIKDAANAAATKLHMATSNRYAQPSPADTIYKRNHLESEGGKIGEFLLEKVVSCIATILFTFPGALRKYIMAIRKEGLAQQRYVKSHRNLFRFPCSRRDR